MAQKQGPLTTIYLGGVVSLSITAGKGRAV
jgi:hypothetical protein